MERSPRHLLLPGWLRFFAWLFLIFGVIEVGVLLGGMVVDASIDRFYLNFLGIKYQGPLRAWLPAALVLSLGAVAWVSFTLLWGRKEGRILGLIACYGYYAVAACAFVVGFRQGHITISPSPILMVFPIMALHRAKQGWNSGPDEPPVIGIPPGQPVV